MNQRETLKLLDGKCLAVFDLFNGFKYMHICISLYVLCMLIMHMPLNLLTIEIQNNYYAFVFHRCQSVLNKLKESNIRQILIPGGFIGDLEPLDLTVNDCLKEDFKAAFTMWHAMRMAHDLKA